MKNTGQIFGLDHESMVFYSIINSCVCELILKIILFKPCPMTISQHSPFNKVSNEMQIVSNSFNLFT